MNTNVYYFQLYDIANDKIIKSKRRANMYFINKHNFDPIIESKLEVPIENLDPYGFYNNSEDKHKSPQIF